MHSEVEEPFASVTSPVRKGRARHLSLRGKPCRLSDAVLHPAGPAPPTSRPERPVEHLLPRVSARVDGVGIDFSEVAVEIEDPGEDSRLTEDRLELRRRRKKLLLGELSCGDVAGDLRGPNHFACAILDRRNRKRHVESAAILRKPHGLVVLDVIACPYSSEDLVLFVLQISRDQRADVLAEDLFRPIPEDPLRARVPARDRTVKRLRDDRVVRSLNDGTEVGEPQLRVFRHLTVAWAAKPSSRSWFRHVTARLGPSICFWSRDTRGRSRRTLERAGGIRSSCGKWLGCGRTRAAPPNARPHRTSREAPIDQWQVPLPLSLKPPGGSETNFHVYAPALSVRSRNPNVFASRTSLVGSIGALNVV